VSAHIHPDKRVYSDQGWFTTFIGNAYTLLPPGQSEHFPAVDTVKESFPGRFIFYFPPYL
ncbi:hypothetical protein ACVT1Q_23185, partial [Klebsiella pneumoniae]